MPKPYAFEPGVQYELRDVGWYHILKVLSADQILVRNMMTTYEEAHNTKDLHEKWNEGRLAFGMHGRNLREVEGCPIKTSYEFTDLDFLRSEPHEPLARGIADHGIPFPPPLVIWEEGDLNTRMEAGAAPKALS